MNDQKPKTVFEEREALRAEIERLKGQLAAVVRERDVAKKVADVAVEYREFKGSIRDHMMLGVVLFAAVAEYSRLTETADFFERPGVARGLEGLRDEEKLAARPPGPPKTPRLPDIERG